MSDSIEISIRCEDCNYKISIGYISDFRYITKRNLFCGCNKEFIVRVPNTTGYEIIKTNDSLIEETPNETIITVKNESCEYGVYYIDRVDSIPVALLISYKAKRENFIGLFDFVFIGFAILVVVFLYLLLDTSDYEGGGYVNSDDYDNA